MTDWTYTDARQTCVSRVNADGGYESRAVSDPAVAAFIAAGHRPAAAPAPAYGLADYSRAVTAHIDAVAQARQYDSALSLASYLASSNASWHAEAVAFVAWRDAVWTQALAALAAWQAGGSAPALEPFIASLPAIVWPA